MNFESIQSFLAKQHYPYYHFTSLVQQLQNGISSYDELTTWPKSLRQSVNQIPFYSYTASKLTPGLNHTAKALLTFPDSISIETVFIQTKPHHYSVCVSCQSGCAMGCQFCATGTLGLLRSLTAEEITDQLLFWHQTYPHIRPKSIVFMGMGEPFTNQANVFTAIRWFHDYYGLGYRHLTVSTCGLPAGIRALAKTFPQVNLAVSLHAANQQLRQTLMPIAKTVSLESLSNAIKEYIARTNRQVTLEYLLIQNINDAKIHLDQLISFTRQFTKGLIHINLIGYNQTATTFTKPSRNRRYFALNYLKQHQVSATIRKSLGEDIIGACGQLALTKALSFPSTGL